MDGVITVLAICAAALGAVLCVRWVHVTYRDDPFIGTFTLLAVLWPITWPVMWWQHKRSSS